MTRAGRGSRWLAWSANDEESLAPAKLKRTNQGGYAFPTQAEREGKYPSVMEPSFDLEEAEVKGESVVRCKGDPG